MLLTTTYDIDGKEYETLGLVTGSTIQTVNAIRDIGAGLKTLMGGEVKKYTNRMVEEAENMVADAIICVRYSSSAVMQGAAEVMVYGTAIKFK